MFERIYNWIDCRIGLTELVRKEFKEYYVPRDVSLWSTLGFVTLVGFLIQAITGIFLLTYYVPHPDHAFASILKIMNRVPYGWLFRTMHIVGANLLMIVLFLHIIFVFYRAGYKKPRELNWLTGAVLFVVVLLFCITGYLLPWSQLSYWSTTIMTAIPTIIPGVGDYISRFIKGGEYVTGITLTRFFAFHVAFLPFILIVVAALHVFFIWRTGFSSLYDDPEICKKVVIYTGRPQYKDGKPFYPDFFNKYMLMMFVYLIAMFFIITFNPDMFLSEYAYVQADPLSTPLMIRPPWYFLAPYAMIRVIPNKFLGISIQLILLVLFLVWPFLDTGDEKNIRKRPILLGLFSVAIITWVVLTFLGRF